MYNLIVFRINTKATFNKKRSSRGNEPPRPLILNGSISMSIYQEETVFKPTYLYIKQHTVTGLLYFGKTVLAHDKMLEYRGSGTYWKKHLRTHGKKHIVTLWYCLFYDQDTIREFALMCSECWDIIRAKDSNGKKIWANLVYETGTYATNMSGENNPFYGKRHSAESNEKNRLAHTGKLHSDNSIEKMIKSRTGKPCKESAKLKISIANKNKRKSDIHKLHLKEAKSNQIILTCPHCLKSSKGAAVMYRWHFDNCKLKT